MAAADQLTAIMNLVGSLKGQKQTQTTTGGKQVTQTDVSQQGIDEILKQILSGPGGVRDVGGAARRSGLYDATSEDLLLQNLYATAATKAELARSPTTVTSTPTTTVTKTPGTDIKDLAAGIGGAFLASQALNLGAKALSPAVEAGTSYVSDLVSGLFGGTGGGGTGAGTGPGTRGTLGDINFGGYGDFGGNIASSGTGIATGEGYGLNTSTLGNFGGGTTSQPGAKGINFGLDLDTGATTAGVGGFGGLGGLLGSVLGGITGSAGAGGGGGGGGGRTVGTVICTALMERGLLDKKLYEAGAKYIEQVNPYVKVGYHSWAIEIAEKIRQGSRFHTAVCLPFAKGRTALLASSGSFVAHMQHPLGTLTKFVGEPICWIIGKVIIAKLKHNFTAKGA